MGEQGHGIRNRFQNGSVDGMTVEQSGDILLDVQGGMITTKNVFAYGLYNQHEGIGLLDVDVRDLEIKTESTGIYRETGTLSHGIWAQHTGDGDIRIDVRDGSITTADSFSYGIYGTHRGTGNIMIDTRDGHTITTTGVNAHGIVAYHYGEEDSRTIGITVGGTVDAGGAGAHGVRVGVVNDMGEAERVAGMGADGYRRQSVTVDGEVTGGSGDAAGVFLAGGGKVFIGPMGTVGADSGIAIRASGDTPKLYVDMNLDGRRVTAVIGDDYIVNDGGETTIAVNDVKLHDGAEGVVPNASAPNGAWDVTIREDGLTVDAGTDPWTISARSTSTVADRDFSADDFNETDSGREPEPQPNPNQNPNPESEPEPEPEPQPNPNQNPNPEPEPEPEPEPQPNPNQNPNPEPEPEPEPDRPCSWKNMPPDQHSMRLCPISCYASPGRRVPASVSWRLALPSGPSCQAVREPSSPNALR